MTFYGAQESCRDQGGHLAHVNTVREQVFLEDYLNQIYKRHRESAIMNFLLNAFLITVFHKKCDIPEVYSIYAEPKYANIMQNMQHMQHNYFDNYTHIYVTSSAI